MFVLSIIFTTIPMHGGARNLDELRQRRKSPQSHETCTTSCSMCSLLILYQSLHHSSPHCMALLKYLLLINFQQSYNVEQAGETQLGVRVDDVGMQPSAAKIAPMQSRRINLPIRQAIWALLQPRRILSKRNCSQGVLAPSSNTVCYFYSLIH